jgi:hypothetical protein
VTYPAIASRAGVSRTFRYDNPAARDLISAAITRAATRRQHDQAGRDARAEASWQQRALNAEQALKAARAKIRAQRARISELLGELRDTQREQDRDARQRLTAENTTRKQRLRQLTSDQRAMEEKLQAARSSNRFLDKRIAGLEAQLLDAGMSRRT